MANSLRRADYLAANLTFADDKITWYCNITKDTREVAMSWEEPIFTKAVDLCVNEGDDVLECGFGMGILADKIQAKNPGSHTITETHPELIEKAKAWAVGKSNVTIVEDSWMTLLEAEGRYNAMFQMNAYADDDLHPNFVYFARNKAKNNCKISWWNWTGDTTDEFMRFYWPDGITFTEVTGLNPPENTYYNRTNHFIPVKTLSPNPTGYGVVKGTKIHTSTSETINIDDVGTNYNILTCADPASPSLITKQNSTCLNVKCKGIYTINDGLLVATGTHPIIIKRSGSWVEKNMNELVVGDKLYKVDNTEVEITKIDFDSSETIYEITRVIIGYNYFVNDILVKGGTDA